MFQANNEANAIPLFIHLFLRLMGILWRCSGRKTGLNKWKLVHILVLYNHYCLLFSSRHMLQLCGWGSDDEVEVKMMMTRSRSPLSLYILYHMRNDDYGLFIYYKLCLSCRHRRDRIFINSKKLALSIAFGTQKLTCCLLRHFGDRKLQKLIRPLKIDLWIDFFRKFNLICRSALQIELCESQTFYKNRL